MTVNLLLSSHHHHRNIAPFNDLRYPKDCDMKAFVGRFPFISRLSFGSGSRGSLTRNAFGSRFIVLRKTSVDGRRKTSVGISLILIRLSSEGPKKEIVAVSRPESVESDSKGLQRPTTAFDRGLHQLPRRCPWGIVEFRRTNLYGYPVDKLSCESCLG